jgi:hypothetical protein
MADAVTGVRVRRATFLPASRRGVRPQAARRGFCVSADMLIRECYTSEVDLRTLLSTYFLHFASTSYLGRPERWSVAVLSRMSSS